MADSGFKRSAGPGGAGRGGGRGGGRGMGAGGGNRRGPGGAGLGPAGSCVCPKCGTTFPHTPGEPCMQARCPECGVALVREGSPHHQEILKRRSADEGKTTE